jgi:Holliday junction resolvase RusA-like endonuclease
MEVTLVIPGLPIGKPRQTKRDVWLNPPRPPVQKYRDWCDKVRESIKEQEVVIPPAASIQHINWTAYFPPCERVQDGRTKSGKIRYRKTTLAEKGTMLGELYRRKPDIDNIAKCWDCLFDEDEAIAFCTLRKEYSQTPRTEVRITYEESV